MRLRPDLSFLPLDHQVVVFSEETQSLVGLNASAAYIARQVGAGKTSALIARALDRINFKELIHWIAEIECSELPFASLEAAADLLQQLAPPMRS
jgi:hypothetical protein